MEAQESPLDQIIAHTEDYLKTRQQLTQHVITEKVVVLTSTMVTAYVLFAVFAMAALFASLGLAGWISRSMDDPLAGYWVLASVYALIGLLFVIRSDAAALREQLKPMNILMNTITSLTGVQMSKSTFVNNGFVFGLSLMLQRLLLKTENQVAEQVHRWTEAFISKINDFMSKHSGGSKAKD